MHLRSIVDKLWWYGESRSGKWGGILHSHTNRSVGDGWSSAAELEEAFMHHMVWRDLNGSGSFVLASTRERTILREDVSECLGRSVDIRIRAITLPFTSFKFLSKTTDQSFRYAKKGARLLNTKSIKDLEESKPFPGGPRNSSRGAFGRGRRFGRVGAWNVVGIFLNGMRHFGLSWWGLHMLGKAWQACGGGGRIGASSTWFYKAQRDCHTWSPVLNFGKISWTVMFGLRVWMGM